MGRISDWLDNFLMGGDEGKVVDITSIEEQIPIEKHLEAGKLRIEEARKENKEEEEAEDGLKYVIDGAKLKCDLCTVPEGELKVNYDTPSTQDKRTATVVEKDKTSLIFKGNCKKSPQSASPCASVMKLADWKDVGTVYFQDEFPLLLKSTIKCEYGGVPIKITDCGQRCEPEYVEMNISSEKKILSIKWMCSEIEEQIKEANEGDKLSLLVKTKNYKEGENITIKVKEKKGREINEGIEEIILSGTVNFEGIAELKEEILLENVILKMSSKILK